MDSTLAYRCQGLLQRAGKALAVIGSQDQRPRAGTLHLPVLKEEKKVEERRRRGGVWWREGGCICAWVKCSEKSQAVIQ